MSSPNEPRIPAPLGRGVVNKGYTVVTETWKSCLGCDYHDHTMIRSGRNPLYHNRCQHPQWKDEFSDRRVIGGTDYTPSWCPLIPTSDRY